MFSSKCYPLVNWDYRMISQTRLHTTPPITVRQCHRLMALTLIVLDIKILHPGILILTKLKRWSTNCDSTRPKTIKKNKSDGRDIRYIVDWLFSNGPEFIRFEAYRGKTKPELLAMIRKYHDKNIGDVEHLQCLRSIMPHDWDDMLALPPPEQESSVMP